jgi:hypothetical protein
MVRPDLGQRALLADVAHQRGRIGELASRNCIDDALRPGIDFSTLAAAQRLDVDDLEQVLDLLGSGPKRSISSAPKASISPRVVEVARRR